MALLNLTGLVLAVSLGVPRHVPLESQTNIVATMDTLSPSAPADTPSAEVVVGQKAPRLTVHQWLNAPENMHTSFGDGHVYVLFFTATWCGICQEVYPVLDTLLKTFASRGVRAIYATRDFLGDGSLKKYFAGHHVTSPVAIYDDSLSMRRNYFGGQSITYPALFVIDGAGRVQHTVQGWSTDEEQELTKEIAKLAPSSPTQKSH